jgi:2-dehydro-3-deoxygluconokinase
MRRTMRHMPHFVTFGELMLRLSPPGALRITQATSLDVAFGGAEANVAVALAALGESAGFVTRLPDNPLTTLAVQTLRGLGVDTGGIARGGDRLGVYYIEPGAGNRPAVVTYDRAHSAIAEADPTVFDWHTLLSGADALHLTGITPALSDACRRATLEAATVARARGVFVSVDINYRSKLWSPAEAAAAMDELLPLTDLCFASQGDLGQLFGITDEDYRQAGGKLVTRFPNLQGVAATLREPFVGSLAALRAGLLWKGTYAESQRFTFGVVDRIGAGDAFAAGVLLRLIEGAPAEDAIAFGAALGSLKHSIVGDFCPITRAEVEELLASGDQTGRVQR